MKSQYSKNQNIYYQGYQTCGYSAYEYSGHHSEQKSSRNRSKRRSMKHILTGAMMFIFVFGFIVFYNTSYAQDIQNQSAVQSDVHADDHTAHMTKYYKTVEITSGDTLWDIAETYMDDNYNSVKDYVQELKEMNHLTSDVIQDGQYLTVAYYL